MIKLLSRPLFNSQKVEQWLIQQKVNLHQAWWVLVTCINLWLITLVFDSSSHVSFTVISISHFLLATLIRNEFIVHFLYRLAVRLSAHFPYGKYYINASVHHIGGIHAACATWGLIWLLIDLVSQFSNPTGYPKPPILITTSYLLPGLLSVIILTALPAFRHRFHNVFEKVHRYIGWLSLIVLIVHIVVLQVSIDFNQLHPIKALLTDPVLLMAIAMISSIALPWVTVQRFENFKISSPSPGVAILTIPGMAEVGTFARISTDFMEWHSFSVAGIYFNPETGESEIQLIIGAAGDWTKTLIQQVQSGHPPQALWVRKVKPPGFMFSINAYSRVVVIATGAGIAPVLPHLMNNKHKLSIIWIGNDHEVTYGTQIYSLLANHPRFRLYDTGIYGRPNVAELATQMVQEFGAQAVFCVSNPPVTRAVVQACLTQGIPAYGATWDS
jgi:NAD(P)H-flavin reductase